MSESEWFQYAVNDLAYYPPELKTARVYELADSYVRQGIGCKAPEIVVSVLCGRNGY